MDDADRLADPSMIEFIRRIRDPLARMQMEHQFAVDEVLTKVSILRREFLHLHRYNPIEHVGSRVKSTPSILDKVLRRGIELSPEAIRAGITDIAGVRITCSFIADTYRILDTLTAQADVRVVTIKDYIADPKPNGYKSLHAILEIPVFLTTGPVPTIVEVQIRTIAMDFWASLEHKIYYKYEGAVPAHLTADLSDAAEVAAQLDRRMEHLHQEVRTATPPSDDAVAIDVLDEKLLRRIRERIRHQQRGNE
ncbi:GTP pyrophosphokinase family protein [Tomitella fengzijianii]|uniref:GTP pyrophosphokinase family protein n=1 Tax=Tomitella fengzijianii TaxID=2597660 RepID=A0A516X799_9ACTN|nr:GTP pyrophosphokinase family protein [Tomitella fengzijianii]QDQ98883.1 GTP pyrophosphokinase family protein [Tomitella fengzijianii]